MVVPAFRVAHVYRQDFDGQVRGISWLRPSIDAIEKLSKYTDDVTDALDILVKMPQYIQLSEDFGQLELSNATASELLDLALRASVDRRVAIPPGAELKSLQTPDMLRGSQVAEIEGVHERRVSRGTGVSTHTLTGSQSDANLSSIRAGEAENQQVYQRLQHVLTKGVKKVVRIWLDYHRIIDPRCARSGHRARSTTRSPAAGTSTTATRALRATRCAMASKHAAACSEIGARIPSRSTPR